MGAYPPISNMWGQQVPVQGQPTPQVSSPESPLPNFFQAYHQAFGQQDLPDTAYDAYRGKFFQDQIAPWGMQQGHALEPLRQEFMKQTEREGRSAAPRAALVAKSALAAALAPARVFGSRVEEEARQSASNAAEEAARRGISPALYQMLGDALGTAPYWAAGLGTAGEIAEAGKFTEMGTRALKAASMGVIQGTYDSAKAPAGQRITEGFQGAVAGTAMGAAFEFTGPLWRYLRSTGVGEAEAKAVQAVAKGVATDSEHDLATQAILNNPKLDERISEYVGQKVKAATAAGVPQDTGVTPPNGRIFVQMKGADGKPYLLGGVGGMSLKDTNATVSRIGEHLKAGGSVDAVNGDPVVVHYFMGAIEKANPEAFGLEVTEGGAKASPETPGRVEANDTVLDEGKQFGTPGGVPSSSLPGYADWWASEQAGPVNREVRRGTAIPPEEGEDWKLDRDTTPSVESESVPRSYMGQRLGPQDIPLADLSPGSTRQKLLSQAATLYQQSGLDVKEIAERVGLSFQDVAEHLDTTLPESTATEPYGKTRGSVDIPLNDRGQAQVSLLGSKLAGQFDKFYSGDMTRTQQTLRALISHNPAAGVEEITPNLRSWARGEFEGGDPDVAREFGASLSQDAPGVRYPGASPQSTQPGESFNEFRGRVRPQMAKIFTDAATHPDERIGVVTHYNPIRLVDAWAHGEGTDVNVAHFNAPEQGPGHIYKVEFDPESLKPTSVTAVNPNGSGELPPADGKSVYMVRHGETDWNPAPEPSLEQTPFEGQSGFSKKWAPADPVVDRPLAEHLITPGGTAASTTGATGEKPYMIVDRDLVGKEMIHHEMLHAHLGYMGLHDFVQGALDQDIAYDMFNGGLDAGVRAVYGPRDVPEETFAYLSGAIRSGNKAQVQAFIEADTDKESVLGWYTQSAKKILDEAATLEDSLHKRTLERRLNYTIAQASRHLDDVGAPFSTTHTVDYDAARGLYSAEDLKTGETLYNHDREALIKELEPNQEPLNSPELVDTSNIPPTPRFARALTPPNTGRAPITTDPPAPPPTPIEAGTLAISNLFRPFYDWVGSVATKFSRNDLADTVEGVRDAWGNYNNAIRPYAQALQDTIAKPIYDGGRRQDFYKYIEAPTASAKDNIIREFHFTAQELADVDRFDNAFRDVEGFHEHIQKTIPEMRDQGWDVETRFRRGMESGESVIGKLMLQGRLDPRDQDVLKVADTVLRGNMFRDHVKGAIDAFETLVNEEKQGVVADGEDKYTFGILRNAMKRQAEFWRGQPDFTQRVVFSAMQQGKDLINKGIKAVNSHLPEAMQMGEITDPPRDILGKFILYNYAGSLGLRPSVPIRDMMGYYLTSYPLLGEKYMWRGMTKAFSNSDSEAYQEALHNGWLLERHQLPESVAGGGETTTSQGGAWVNRAMSAITWSQNAKRIAAGHGFAEKIGDALEGFAQDGDRDRFVRESGLWFLSDARRDMRVREAAAATGSPAEMRRVALRAAKDLVDATQWDYQKGAAPGIYKYQIGRLFGQYGTWPMNYVEYARKFVTRMPSEYRTEAIQALTRLTVAHGAILSAAQNVGIDASHWVFSQPMAYGGGPLYQAVTNIPQSMDFETYKGAEARRQLIEPIWPGLVPGGNEAHNIWRAVTDGDESAWIRILGFTPMQAGEKAKGLHKFVP